ncbi:MAG: winged helix DNA-binding domain-containing protein [Chloroflexia bacterium]
MITLTWKQVWARRLARHSLLERAPSDAIAATVGAVCGIQAQVMPAAELGVGIRVNGVTRGDVQVALWETRALVKTFGIRGTIHLFPSDELPLWMAALRARSVLDVKGRERLGLDPAQLTAVLDSIAEGLDGRRLTMQELGDRIVRQAGSWAGEATQGWSGTTPRWRMALSEAALAGLLCYGPPQGNQVTFVRPDQWTGAWRDQDEHHALAEVFRRYLRAYGPATPRDFAQWFNLPPPAARNVAASLDGELREVDVEGYRAYLLADDVEGWAANDPDEPLPLRLLPHFDCYVIGCHPRDQLLPADWKERVPPRTIPSQLQLLLVDGKVAGVWDRQTKGKRIELRVEHFGTLNKGQRARLEEEAARIGTILEGEAALTIDRVEVRPHL